MAGQIRLVMRGVAMAASLVFFNTMALAAPYAGMVIDARSGEVLHARNADTRLHPASLTKMMTLYVTFEAIERGEISVDRKVTISRNAAAEPPSKLGLKAGQKIAVRYLIRAAAVKSANDAATALAEAVGGSEAAFIARMNRTAQALGMTSTTFRNAHGLTASGHLSTARDMTTLGRRLFYDYPNYYNLFSRHTTHAGVTEVANTNRRFLGAYRGADGIKTGYTRAAGFNLVASAERGGERIIATVFGGSSTAARNKKVAELLDLGFARAPTRVAVQKPAPPDYASVPAVAVALAEPDVPEGSGGSGIAAGKTLRVALAVTRSRRPPLRPLPEVSAEVVAQVAGTIDQTLSLLDLGTAGPGPLAAAATGPLVDLAEAVEIVVGEVAAEVVEVAETAADPAPAPPATPEAEAPGVAVAAADAAPIAPVAPVAPIVPTAAGTAPAARPAALVVAAASVAEAETEAPPTDDSVAAEIVTRMSGNDAGRWGITVGKFGSRYQAERVLLETALLELGTLDRALRKVVPRSGGFQATFTGMSEGQADRACARLAARERNCMMLSPG